MNLSLTLNVLLLIGVVIAIVRTVRLRRREEQKVMTPPPVSQPSHLDDIISVRKVTEMPVSQPSLSPFMSSASVLYSDDSQPIGPRLSAVSVEPELVETETAPNNFAEKNGSTEPLMMFLLAKADRQLAGYELLQAVLSAGFRFGEGALFHRHQYPNGQGTIMCSLAAATKSGVFDLQHIGGFVVRGLCLFMHVSGNAAIDAERFDIMLDTAKTLSDSLDTLLLDEHRKPLSESSVAQYYERLSLTEDTVC